METPRLGLQARTQTGTEGDDPASSPEDRAPWPHPPCLRAVRPATRPPSSTGCEPGWFRGRARGPRPLHPPELPGGLGLLPCVRRELSSPAPRGWRKVRAGGAEGDRGWVATARPRLRPVHVSPETPLCKSLFMLPRHPQKAGRLQSRKGRRSVRRGFLEGSPVKRGRGSKATC